MKIIELNRHTALRVKSLGALGELLGIKALVDAGFINIKNLNDEKKNYPFADLYGERNGNRYVISVKARNRYQANGFLNKRYNLCHDCKTKASLAESHFNAKPAWLAISIFDGVYSVYFGTLDMLTIKTGIPMSEQHLHKYECIVNERQHGIDFRPYKNIYDS